MKKFYLKNGKEVQIGDTITKVTKTKNLLFGEGTIVESIVVTKATLPKLIEKGIITASLGSDFDVDSMNLHYYIEKLAKKLNWKVEKVYNYLSTIDSIYPAAAFSMILREVAIELDKTILKRVLKSM